jgi:hypothetical protein
MAHLSGTFSSAKAGKLCVTVTGTYTEGTNMDAGFPSTGHDMLVQGVVNGTVMHPISRTNPVSYAEFDYPGGSANWSVLTYRLANGGSGTQTYGFINLAMTLQLRKK